MNPTEIIPTTNRRNFLRATTASAFAGLTVPFVHAQGDNAINVALIGCGGRGSGAAKDALKTTLVPTKLVAMADVFNSKLEGSHSALQNEFAGQPGKVDVGDRKFIGFDGYQKAIDCLKPGDVAIFATPLAFRWVHFKYAVEKGINVFMEKPLTADAPTSKRMLEINQKAKEKNLKVGVGLMVRHCRVRQELYKRIRDGEIGEINLMRAYRMHPPSGTSCQSIKNKILNPPDGKPEVMYQIDRFHSFLWASGGLFNDFNIHQIDECCWMKDAWPVKVNAMGGRHYKKSPEGHDFVDQNFDTYNCEFTFADGAILQWSSRIMFGCKQDFHSFAHASKGSAVISMSGHSPGKCQTFRGQKISKEDRIWQWPEEEEQSPYQLEWDDLIEAIVKNKPYNEVDRGVMASLVSSMGRYAAHTGQEVKLADFQNHTHEFAPDVDKITVDGPAPVAPDADGFYPTPMPGKLKDREY